MRILIAEDQPELRRMLVKNLMAAGYTVDGVPDGAEALAYLDAAAYDAAVLDIMMPKVDGLTVLRTLRARGSALPVLLLTARDAVADRVDGLDAGADDYLIKPFALDELLARLRVTFRRISMLQNAAGCSVFTNGDLQIDFAAGCATLKGQELHLTPIEYKLLCLLSHNVDKVLTHSFILHEVWSNNHQADLASLRVFMGTLRKKIEPDPVHPRYIQTHIGVGYRMMRVADE